MRNERVKVGLIGCGGISGAYLGMAKNFPVLDIAACADLEINRAKAQAEKYAMCFRLFRNYKHVISSITFWNLSDRYSWLDNFPVRNRKDYPLLFDRAGQPKKAYWEVVKTGD